MAERLELGMISSTWAEQWFPQTFRGTMGRLMRAIEEDREPEISGREGRAVPISEMVPGTS